MKYEPSQRTERLDYLRGLAVQLEYGLSKDVPFMPLNYRLGNTDVTLASIKWTAQGLVNHLTRLYEQSRKEDEAEGALSEQTTALHSYDVELRPNRTRQRAETRLTLFTKQIEQLGGNVTDTYFRSGDALLARVHVNAEHAATIRAWPMVLALREPPKPDLPKLTE